MPTPPVQEPTFSGPAFDPAQDPTYSGATAADKAQYDGKVQAANDKFSSDESDAAKQRQQSLDSARTTEENAFKQADGDYKTAMDVPNPINLDAIGAQVAALDQGAIDTYTSAFIGANLAFLGKRTEAYAAYVGTVWPGFEPHDAAYRAAEEQLAATLASLTGPNIDPSDPAFLPAYNLYYQQVLDAYHACDVAKAAADQTFGLLADGASVTYANTVDGATAAHDTTVADALYAEQKTFDADMAIWQTGLADARRWDAQHKAAADRDRQVAYDLAEKNYATAGAQATQTYDDKLATAAQTRDNKIADALQTQELDDAEALSQAGEKFATSAAAASADPASDPNVLWANYQATLAYDESQHEESTANEQHQVAYDENQAAYDRATNVDQANETRDETIAVDRQKEQDAEAGGLYDFLYGRADNEHQRALDDLAAWKSHADNSAGADHSFNTAAIGAALAHNLDFTSTNAPWTNADLHSEFQLVVDGDQQKYKQALAEHGKAGWIGIAGDNEKFWDGLAGANATRDTSYSGVEEGYTDGLSASLAKWTKQNDKLMGDDEMAIGTALAKQDKLDVAARDGADGKSADLAATEVQTDAQ
ncbi:MAG TPA: hypothetical protein VGX76_08370, partial [Pirellulales bacterium]|nr:hypothetical protein [Pirellulales bacterium]